MSNLSSLLHFLPELLLTVIILLSVVFELIPRMKRLNRYFVLLGLVLVGVLLSMSGGESLSLFMGMIAVDPFALFFKWILLFTTFVIILITRDTAEMDEKLENEFNTLLLIVLFGLFLMASATNLVMVYLSIETVSIASYVLAGMLKNDPKSNEASLKYVIFGAFASGLMLYGFSWLYGLSGSTDLTAIRDVLMYTDHPFVVYMAILMVLVGIGYKLSMVPFHYWTPDVYEGAPTPLTAFLSIAPKAAGMAMLFRVFGMTFTGQDQLPVANVDWTGIVAVLSAITMTVGNLMAIQQTNVKRLLAYSSIAHAGYMLMVVPVISKDSIEAVMIYLVMYMFMNLGAFLVAISVRNSTGSYELEHWNGLGKRAPLLGAMMVIFLVSLTGLPPTAGFIGKVYLFAVLIKHQQFYWLAVVGIINSVISLFFYFRIARQMYLTESQDSSLISTRPLLKWVVVACAVPVLALGIYWSPVIDWINQSTGMF